MDACIAVRGGACESNLVLAVVASDGTVRGLGLDGLSVGGDQHGGHQTQRAVALGDDICRNTQPRTESNSDDR